MDQLLYWRDKFVPQGMIFGILFVGDRIFCCDEAVGLEVDGDVVAVATIAPDGEEKSGQPEIVALYVRKDYRCQRYGLSLLEAAIARCEERGLQTPIKVDVLSSRLMEGIERKLDSVVKAKLEIHDLTGLSMMDMMADRE